MKDVVGMGVVGAGSIGIRAALMHLSLPDVQDRVRITAVCDPVPGRAAAAAERYSVPGAYETLNELLEDPNVDMVTLCSPIGLHYEQGMAAIRAGKHVHFNKTMCTMAAEADEMIALAAEKNVRLVASPGMMLHPYNRRIRRHLLEGALGTLVWAATGTAIGTYHLTEGVRQGNDLLSNIDPSWYFRSPGGGPQYDVTVYCLHNLTGLLGPAKRVTALSGLVLPQREYRGQTIAADMDDSTLMLLDFGNAAYAFVYGTVVGKVTDGFMPSLFGTDGQVVGTKFNDEDLRLPGDHQPHVLGPHAEMEESHVFEDLMQLVDWVREGKPSVATAEHARHVVEIIEAGYRSAETGQAQVLTTTFDALSLDALQD